ncbi:MAG: prephenate dehydrogenase/arogenate dehydrogenase family protein [Planctomycetaceae bacterium]
MITAKRLEFESSVVVIGVGLIGGSIAAAIRQRFPTCRIMGIGRSRDRLVAAQAAGLIDHFDVRIAAESFPSGSLSVVCLPVDRIAASVREILCLADDQSVVTDAGSVKQLIYDQLHEVPAAFDRFVGSHPIAGAEQSGFEHAQPNLFDDRMCVVTPESGPDKVVERVCRFWRMLGCNVAKMSATVHDQILAHTSHLPHLLAAVSASAVTAEELKYTGTGFRDTTRVAAGSSELWTTILLGNRGSVLDSIRTASKILIEFENAIEKNDSDALRTLLSDAAKLRQMLHETK